MTREELERLIKAGTPDRPWHYSPWHVEEGAPAVRHPSGYIIANTDTNANAALICAAVNALPELLAVKAERDRAQRACEQMGARIASLENLIRAMIENEPDDSVSDGGHTVLDLWRHDARAALKETQDE